ncbi:MAG TPA: FAD-binding protein, partial [Anaerolineales bacterium]|nr:FAD-binding protein [Anaerolineales bacterium]
MTIQNNSTRSQPETSTLSSEKLRSAINGQVILPGDIDYDHARVLFYGGFDRRPAAILRVADTADVVRVISLAREAGWELAVRSGGHSVVGH